MLASEETTGATTAHRNFVRDQMHIERGAQTPHLLQIHRAVHGHAASTLHQGLDDDCADMRSTCLQQRFQFTCSTQRDLVCGFTGKRLPGIRRHQAMRGFEQCVIRVAKDRRIGHTQSTHGLTVVTAL